MTCQALADITRPAEIVASVLVGRIEVDEVDTCAVCGRIEHRKPQNFLHSGRSASLVGMGSGLRAASGLLNFIIPAHQHGASDIILLVRIADDN